MLHYRRLAVFTFFLCYLAAMSFVEPAPVDRPLPDLNAFLQKLKKKLEYYDDKVLLSNYTYRKKETVENLKKDNTTKDTETKEYEVYYLGDKPYQKLISKNGVPLSAKELKKQDDEQAKRAERAAKVSEKQNQAKAEKRRKEHQETLDDVFQGFQFRMLGREIIDGHSVIVVAFTPRKEAKFKTRLGNMILKKITGKAWIEENEYQPIKAEMEFIDNVTFGTGLFAKVEKGATFMQIRRKINDEIWLPSRDEIRFKARLALVKGFNIRQTADYSDYRKFSVSTNVKFSEEKK